jgi:hypothetical protein
MKTRSFVQGVKAMEPVTWEQQKLSVKTCSFVYGVKAMEPVTWGRQ